MARLIDLKNYLAYPSSMAETNFDGRSVWITGASSGIGASLALALGRRGAKLILSGRNVPALEARASSAGGPASILPFSLADPKARENAVIKALEIYNGIDMLILNAGVSQRSLFMDTSEEVFSAIMETNFFASVEITRRILPSMLQRGSGTIVCVSSLAGLMGAPHRTSYAASKHALAGFFTSLRSELYNSPIKIILVYPGFVATSISHNAFSGDGTLYNRMDPLQANGQDPQKTADLILSGIAAGKLDIKVAMDAKSRFGLFLSRHCPAILAKALAARKDL